MAIDAVCQACSRVFRVKASVIERGFGKYCSAGCQHESARTGKWFQCEGCQKDVYRTSKYIAASKSKKYFCNKSCQTIWRNKEFSGARHANWKHGMGSYRSIMKRAGREVVCEFCRMTDERVIIVHHRDRKRTNNALSNLVRLCRNCHYIVHNFSDGRTRGLII